MRYRLLFCLLSLAVCFDASAGDLYTAINSLRAGDGICAEENLPPLRPQAALERAARNLAHGDQLRQSLDAAGYRAARSRVFSLTGEGVGARAAGLLANPRYCRQLQDAAMTEIGIYLDARQVWVVTAAPFASSLGMSEQAAGLRVLDLVNEARARARYCGNKMFDAARPVRWNDTLAESSRLHSEDMARYNYFSHSGRDGSDPGQRVERAGYRFRSTGENIAAGAQMNAEDAVAGWIRSPGHCANLMNPAYTDMGAAFAINPRSELGVYWTQAFATPR
jgi:uncharacterized protein YkwD